MNESSFIEVLLTLLTITTGITAILNFANIRRKDNKTDNAKEGELQSDIQYIKSILIDVRSETKEINKLLDTHSEHIARVEESCKQAHKRLDKIEETMRRDK